MENQNLTGIWISPKGETFLSYRDDDGVITETADRLQPFAWSDSLPESEKYTATILKGTGRFQNLLAFENLQSFKETTTEFKKEIYFESIRPLEAQYLMRHSQRLFSEMNFTDLKRCQCDIETYCSVEGGFCNARRKGDRVLAIGLSVSGQTDSDFLVLDEMTDEAEKSLLEKFNQRIQYIDPDVIEGHNIFNFDLEYLRQRCRLLKVPCAWGRFGQNAIFRKSRLRVAERQIDFVRCDIPGRSVFDTYLAILFYDLTKRDLSNYGLKNIAVYFGITDPEKGNRTYLKAHEIQQSFFNDRKTFLAYLGDDLRETAGVAELLLPTYFAQTKNFPTTLQEIILRGTAYKINLILLEKYYLGKHSLPEYPKINRFEGGYTNSFTTGVFKNVLHFDVASLYPSLLLSFEKNPANDLLGIFIPLLKELKDYRLKYKKLAQSEQNKDLQIEYQARQTSYKILINSFYGYLGFEGAMFGDSDLAAEVTRKGRELLQNLIAEFEKLGCQPLEADTDGIYLATDEYWEKSIELLNLVKKILPEGIELELDGSYKAMLCYKAKNYALNDGNKITIRGSALRSRGIEPFLKKLTKTLIDYLLSASEKSPLELAEEYRTAINNCSIKIEDIAKSENLNHDPEKYRLAIESGGKPRRASLEVALKMKPMPKMGDRVSYYISQATKKKPNWQTARSVIDYDHSNHPFDPGHYIKKLDDWIKRYEPFLDLPKGVEQQELF